MLDILEEIEKNGNAVNMQKDKIELGLNFFKENNQPKTNLSGYSQEDATGNVQVVLLCVDNKSFNLNMPTCNLSICGKTMRDWVKNAVQGMNVVEYEMDSKADFLPIVKQNARGKKYTLVLFSDAPLIQHKTVQEIVEYFVLKSLSVLKFSRGYMFETSYLQTIDKLLNPQVQYFEEEDFITCYNMKQFALVSDIMRNRILGYHQRNGVIIIDPNSTFIDADASIESDVVIYPNNKIFGKTKISSGANLFCNNIIKNSIIMPNVKIENSNIDSSVIKSGCLVKNYSTVLNSILEENCTLKGYNFVESMKINPNTTLDVFDKKE